MTANRTANSGRVARRICCEVTAHISIETGCRKPFRGMGKSATGTGGGLSSANG